MKYFEEFYNQLKKKKMYNLVMENLKMLLFYNTSLLIILKS